ncbi:hypothetical protein DPX39_090046100 [Trypanosoma brucei equiperdum]|uniref:Uncharacterized protein n=1 Tax=Trypanosoma brucei equiperdum TaxID=630700 RepID=A0A3L6L0C3_9TRYP|nr:hypothetical protein DPX39_090046100 [Trypanosoma brucei equiperdum]
MEGFKTPNRCTKDEDVCGGGDASFGKRVVRSALEVLAETASPELLRQSRPATLDVIHSPKFTVTNTAAPLGPAKPLRSVPYRLTEPPQQQQCSVSLRKGNVPAEEPSTLLFLSPSAVKVKSDVSVRKSLFTSNSRRKMRCLDSRSRVTVSKGSRQPSTIINGEVSSSEGDIDDEDDDKEEEEEALSAYAPVCGAGEKVSMKQRLFSEAEVQQRIVEALKSYERTRNAEEEAMLQEVGCEIKAQSERYEKLLRETTAVTAERDTLQKKMEYLLRQRDAESFKESREDTAESREQLDLAELSDLRDAVEQVESEKAKLIMQLEACKKEQLVWRQRCIEVESAREKPVEATQVHGGMKAQPQEKLRDGREVPACPADFTQTKRFEFESRIQSLEDALQKQCDEVRRRMHRVYMLEGEQAKSERITKSLRHAVREASDSFERIRRELELCLQAYGTASSNVRAKEETGDGVGHECSSLHNLRGELFPAGMRDELGLLFVGSGANTAAGGDPCGNNTVGGSKGSTIPRPSVRGEFFDSAPGDKLLLESLGAGREVTSIMNRQKDRQTPEEEGAICKRLQQRRQRCERLVEALRRLFLQKQKEQRHQLRRFEAQLAQSAELDVSRYRDALALREVELEKANKQQQRFADEYAKRELEIERLRREVEELRSSQRGEAVQQKGLLEEVERLRRERDALQMQLDLITKECAEVHRRKEASGREFHELQERLTAVLGAQHRQEEENERESKKQLARLAQYTKKLKLAEEECQNLRSENSAMTSKIKVVQQQLQSLRACRQREGSVTQVTHQQQLKKLTSLAEELRQIQKSDAAQHARERAEAEASIQRISSQNKQLQKEIDQLRRSLSEARSEAEQQRWTERTVLETLFNINRGISDETMQDSDKNCDSLVVQRRQTFAPVPELGSNCNATSSGSDIDTNKLRRMVVSMSQRTVLELTRMREAVSVGSHAGTIAYSSLVAATTDCELDKFRVAEQLAWEAAEHSVTRRRPHQGSDDCSTSARARRRAHSFCTPSRRSSRHGSPSPEFVVGGVNIARFNLRSPPVFTDSGYLKENTGNKKRSPDTLSNSPLSTSGVSRSRSGNPVLDGSASPAAPPRLRLTRGH